MGEFSGDIMNSVNAWYVRKNGEVKGPFARGLLLRHRILGRLHAEDEVSVDRINWFLAMDVPALDPHAAMPVRTARRSDDALEWSQERERARKRWMEERWRPDRKLQELSPDELALEHERRATQASPGPRDIVPNSVGRDLSSIRSAVVAFSVIAFILLTAWLMNRYEDKNPLSVHLLPGKSAHCASGATGVSSALNCESREAR